MAYSEYISVLNQYIIEYVLLAIAACAIVIIYLIYKVKKKKINKKEKVACSLFITGFISLALVAVYPAVMDITNISNSIESVSFESAYIQSKNTTYSINDGFIGTPITVDLKNGKKLYLTSVKYFPQKIDNSNLKYAKHSEVIVDYELE